MSDIDELQRRITAAMDRVAGGLDQLGANSGGDTAALEQALEDEKLANAQLSERVRLLKQRQDDELADIKATAAAATAQMAGLDLEVQRVRKANDELRNSNQVLRAANEAGVAEPHLINKAMMAELEALRAARAVDVSETNAIIDALTPLIADAEGAA
jgi:chromosome segregation ATPase|tara:strand:- start:8192 stop:8665 length:474 start_codon:yes stop_codon:yes gene_type:complete